ADSLPAFGLSFLLYLIDCPLFAFALFGVVVGVSLGGKVPARSHRNRSRRNLGKPGRHDNSGTVDCAGQAGGEREWNGQSVRHSNHDIANSLACCEVAFDVSGLRHFRYGSEARKQGSLPERALTGAL